MRFIFWISMFITWLRMGKLHIQQIIAIQTLSIYNMCKGKISWGMAYSRYPGHLALCFMILLYSTVTWLCGCHVLIWQCWVGLLRCVFNYSSYTCTSFDFLPWALWLSSFWLGNWPRIYLMQASEKSHPAYYPRHV